MQIRCFLEDTGRNYMSDKSYVNHFSSAKSLTGRAEDDVHNEIYGLEKITKLPFFAKSKIKAKLEKWHELKFLWKS